MMAIDERVADRRDRLCSRPAQGRVMENESPEYRQLSDGSLWVFIAPRGWTFLRVELSDAEQTVTARDRSGEVALDGAP